MNVLTAAEMAATDRRTVELGTPIRELMENAGSAVARFCLRHYPRARCILVFAGRGNNGGDGFVAARRLCAAGCRVQVVLLGRVEELRGEPAEAMERLQSCGAAVVQEAIDRNSLDHALADEQSHDLIVDAIVGTGFKPPLRGLAALARDWTNRQSIPVVAVDLPSGWDADSTSQEEQDSFRSNAVVTFTSPKRAHVFGHLASARSLSTQPNSWPFGPVVIGEIGSPESAIAAAIEPGSNLHWAGSAKALTDTPRPVNANKGKFGHVLVVGGSRGTAGAPSMSALAALRAGAGLVTAAVPDSVADTVALTAVELMTSPTLEGAEGAFGLCSIAEIEAKVHERRITVLALGPGLSTRGEAPEFARELVARTSLPVVIDADALNAFAGRVDQLHAGTVRDAKHRTVVLTPHPGEMARLCGLSIAQVEADRVGLARSFAAEHGVVLVLKGWRTLIAHPGGRVAVNTTGNPGMAKAGSGDILTGLVAAMLAQYPEDPTRAVEAAVFLHGMAGDIAAQRLDQHTLLATDTLHHLSDAFKQPLRDADGFMWISGVRSSQMGRGTAGLSSRRLRGVDA